MMSIDTHGRCDQKGCGIYAAIANEKKIVAQHSTNRHEPACTQDSRSGGGKRLCTE